MSSPRWLQNIARFVIKKADDVGANEFVAILRRQARHLIRAKPGGERSGWGPRL